MGGNANEKKFQMNGETKTKPEQNGTQEFIVPNRSTTTADAPVVTTDLDLYELTEASLFDLFLRLTFEMVEQVDEQLDEEEDDAVDDDEDVEDVSDLVDEVEFLEGDSHWFFLTRGNVPGGPMRGGASA